MLGGPHRQHAVQLAVFQPALQLSAPAAGDLRRQSGKLLAQRRQRRRQGNLAETLRHAETQRAARLAFRIQQAVEFFRLTLNAQTLLVHPVSGGGQGQRAGLALQQRHVQLLFQTLKTPGDGRLGDPQIFRGLIEGGKLHRGQQSVDIVNAHRILM